MKEKAISDRGERGVGKSKTNICASKTERKTFRAEGMHSQEKAMKH